MNCRFLVSSAALLIVALLILGPFSPIVASLNITDKNPPIAGIPSPPQIMGTSDSWPKYGHDLNNTGYADTRMPEQYGEFWNVSGGVVTAGPAVADGRMVVGTYAASNTLYCLWTNNGTKNWTKPMSNLAMFGTPAIYDNKVYVGTSKMSLNQPSNLYCCYISNGTTAWTYLTGGWVYSSPAIYNDSVYFGSWDGKLYCLNAQNGSLKWFNSTGGQIRSGVAICNNSVITTSLDGYVYAFNADNGTLRWKNKFPSSIYGSASVINGTLYLGDATGKMKALFVDNGKEWWNVSLGSGTRSTAAIGYNHIYVVTFDGKIHCINQTNGIESWNATGLSYPATPQQISAVLAGDRVFVGSNSPNNRLYILRASDGKFLINYSVGSELLSLPTIVRERVYFGTYGGRLRCLGDCIKPNVNCTPSGTWVSLKTNITLDFSEPMDTDSVNASFAMEPAVSGNITWNLNKTHMTFDPAGYLVWDQTYNITISSGAKDLWNNSIIPFWSNFTTEKELSYLHYVSGNNQTGDVDTDLLAPFRVRVENSIGTPKVTRRINWTIVSKPTGSILENMTNYSFTNATGYSEVMLHLGLIEGNYTIHADALGDFVVGNLTFNATGKRLHMYTYSGNNQKNITNSSIPLPLKVRILNHTGSPIAGRPVNWTLTSYPLGATGQNISTNTSYTDAGGIASTNLHLGNKFGNYSVQASAIWAGALEEITFNATAVPYLFQEYSGDGQEDITNVTLPNSLIVRVINSTGVPIPGINVTWSIINAPVGAYGQSLSVPYSITDMNGTAAVNLTLGDKYGDYLVLANTSSPKIKDNYTFTSTAQPYNLSAISGDGQFGILNSTVLFPLVVQAMNLTGAPVQGRLINWTIVSVPAGAMGHNISANWSLTDAFGYASINITVGDMFGKYTVMASGNLTGTDMVCYFNSTAAPYGLSYISGDFQNKTVDYDLDSPLRVMILNQSAQPMEQYWVNWTITQAPTGSTGHFLYQNRSQTNIAGIATTSLHLSNTSGVYKVQAKAERYGVQGFYTFTLRALPDTPYVISVTPGYKILTVDQTQAFTANTYDKWHNKIMITSYNWTCAAGSIDINGTYTAGTLFAMGFVNASLGNLSGKATVKVTNGPPQRIEITPQYPTITADQTINLTATVYDKYVNVWNYSVKWRLDNSSNGTVDAGGVYTPYLVGNWTVFANLSAFSLETNTSIRVIPGKPAFILPSPQNCTINVTESMDFILTAYDNDNNYIPNISVSWSCKGGTPSSSGNKTCKMTAGTKAMQGWLNANSGKANCSIPLNIQPGPAMKLFMTQWPYPLKSNDLKMFRAWYEDKYGNKNERLSVSWSVQNSVGSLTYGSNFTIIKARNVDGIIDSDRDTIPDVNDDFWFDFNNDGLWDNTGNHDADKDSIIDYPWGQDHWINSTSAGTPSIYVNESGAYYSGTITAKWTTFTEKIMILVSIATSGLVGLTTDKNVEPIASCGVTLSKTGSISKTATSNTTGYYRFSTLSPGSYSLMAQIEGYTNATGTADIKKTDWEYIWVSTIKLEKIDEPPPSNSWIIPLIAGIVISVVLIAIIVVVGRRLLHSRKKQREEKMLEEELFLSGGFGIPSKSDESERPTTRIEPDNLEPLKDSGPKTVPKTEVTKKIEDKQAIAQPTVSPTQVSPKPSTSSTTVAPVVKPADDAEAIRRRKLMEDEWRKLEDELLTKKPQKVDLKKTYFQEKDEWLDTNAKRVTVINQKKSEEDKRKKTLDEDI